MNYTSRVLVVLLMLSPALASADDDLQSIQNLTVELQEVDQLIDGIQRQAGESVIRNAGATPEFVQLNNQLYDLKARKRELIAELRRLSASAGERARSSVPQPRPGGRSQPQPSQRRQSGTASGAPCSRDDGGTPSFAGIECQ